MHYHSYVPGRPVVVTHTTMAPSYSNPPARLMLVLLAVCTSNPLQPTNGSFDCPSPALPGSGCNATCDVGYLGAPSSTCQPNGTYGAVMGACELIGGLRRQVCTAPPFGCSLSPLWRKRGVPKCVCVCMGPAIISTRSSACVCGCCWCSQCVEATQCSPSTAALTAPAQLSLAVYVTPLVTLDIRAHPLPPASPMGPTVL
jgi:hypothetical protein